MSNIVAFTPRPRPPEPAALVPLAGLALRACLEEAAQTALDAADKIIAALDGIEDGTERQATEAAPEPRPAMPAQIVCLGDLGSFETSIARPREEAPAVIMEAPQDEAQDEPAPVTTAQVCNLFPPLPWGGASNVVAAAGCAVLALVGMRA